MSCRSAASLAAMLTLAPLGLLAAQQAAAPTGAAPAIAAPVAVPADATAGPAVPQPHASPLFQVRDSAPTLGSVDNATMAASGSSHKIVVSTLVLVLAVVILVLLIT